MTGGVWRLEWGIVRSRPRRLTWSVSVPVLLLVPVAMSGAAPAHRATVYALFVVFFGLFGAAAPVVRDAERGWVERVLLTGCGVRSWLLERTAAHSLQDLLQLAPALGAVIWLEGGARGALPAASVAAGALLALVTANLVGTVVAAAVRSLAEGALACAAVGLAALHLAGAFRPPAPGTWQEAAAAVSPFLPALASFRELAGAADLWVSATSVPGPGSTGIWAGPAAATLLLMACAWTGAPWIGRRLTGIGDQF